MTAFSAAFREEAARIARTRLDLFLLTLFPLVLLGAMAAMISGGTLRDLPVVVVDQDGGPLAREIARNIAVTPSLQLVSVIPDVEEAMSMVRSERAVAIIVIPAGVGGRPPNDAPIQVFYEAVFLSTGLVASTYLRLVADATVAENLPRDMGVSGLTAVEPVLPALQVTLLGNPTLSLEWYLGMLIGPAILHLLIAITCVGSLGLLLHDGSFAAFVHATPAPVPALVGRLAVHVLVGVLWGIAWLLWMTLARGYRAEGSTGAIVLGLVLLFLATAAIALLFVAVTRDVATSLSAAVIVAGSALAYSGATLPLAGGLWFARRWSEVLPLTHYILLQMDQMIGVTVLAEIKPIAALLMYPLVAGGLGVMLVLHSRKWV